MFFNVERYLHQFKNLIFFIKFFDKFLFALFCFFYSSNLGLFLFFVLVFKLTIGIDNIISLKKIYWKKIELKTFGICIVIGILMNNYLISYAYFISANINKRMVA